MLELQLDQQATAYLWAYPQATGMWFLFMRRAKPTDRNANSEWRRRIFVTRTPTELERFEERLLYWGSQIVLERGECANFPEYVPPACPTYSCRTCEFAGACAALERHDVDLSDQILSAHFVKKDHRKETPDAPTPETLSGR